MLKFSDYKLLENYTLKYMAFDWDDNILFMPTFIHMQKNVDGEWIDEDVPTDKFAQVRSDKEWRIIDNDPDQAFAEFRDFGPRGKEAFIEDTKLALSKKKFGPSWDQFIKCLCRGNIFSIITARGHEPETLRRGVEYVIETQLDEEQRDEMGASLTAYKNLFTGSDPMVEFTFDELVGKYLDSCDFIGVTSNYFSELVGDGDSSNPEIGKQLAMEMFAKKVHGYGERIGRKVKLGFSDDDKGNVDHINKFFRKELSLRYVMDYTVFDTSDPKLKGGVRIEERKVYSYDEFKLIEEKWVKPSDL